MATHMDGAYWDYMNEAAYAGHPPEVTLPPPSYMVDYEHHYAHPAESALPPQAGAPGGLPANLIPYAHSNDFVEPYSLYAMRRGGAEESWCTVPHSFWIKPSHGAPPVRPQAYPDSMRPAFTTHPGHPHMPRYPPPNAGFYPKMAAARQMRGYYDPSRRRVREPYEARPYPGQQFNAYEQKEAEDAPTRLRRRKRSEKERVKRPMNSFLIFSNEVRPHLQAKYKDRSNAQISKLIGEQWHNMDPERKKKYIIEAEKIKEDFSKKHPDYVYTKRKRKKRRRNKTVNNVAASPDSGNAQSPLLSLASAVAPLTNESSSQPLLARAMDPEGSNSNGENLETVRGEPVLATPVVEAKLLKTEENTSKAREVDEEES